MKSFIPLAMPYCVHWVLSESSVSCGVLPRLAYLFALGFYYHTALPASFCLLQGGQSSLSTGMLLCVGGMFLSGERPLYIPSYDAILMALIFLRTANYIHL